MSALPRFVVLLFLTTLFLYSCSALALALRMPAARPNWQPAPVRPLLGLWSGSGRILGLGLAATATRDPPEAFVAR